MNTAREASRLYRCRLFAQGASAVSILVAGTVLAGWLLNIPFLKSLLPGGATMKPWTALSFLLASISLWLLSAAPTRGEVGARATLASQLGNALVALIGLLTLGEYLSEYNFGFDEWLFPQALALTESLYPGRMAPGTALGFVLLSGALACQRMAKQSRWRFDQFFALFVIFLGCIALEGYLFGVESLYRISIYSSMAVHTAALFVLLGTGVICARPDTGLMAVVTSQQTGGLLARRLLPLIVVLPLVSGWLSWQGELAGWYDTAFGITLLISTNIMILGTVALLSARQLNTLDAKRQEVMQANLDNEARLAGIIGSAMDGIITLDEQLRIVLFNPAAEKMFGRSVTEMLGQPLEQLLPERFRATHAGHILTFSQTNDTRRKMGGFGEVYGLRADHTEFPIEASISQVPQFGHKLFTVILRDISERKQAERALRASEERLATVIENLTEGLIISTLDGQLLHWNRAALAMFGFHSLAEVLLKLPEFERIFEFRTPDGTVIGRHDWPLTRIIRGEQLDDYVLHTQRLGTEWSRILSHNGALVSLPSGEQVAFITLTDITENKLAEELRRSNADLEQFAYIASHDLQEPLRAVAGCAQLLQRRYQGQLDRQADELFTHTVEGAARMQRLIEDLLAFSRVGKLTRQLQPVDSAKIFAAALANLEVALTESGAAITHDALPTVMTDPVQLTLLFQNLLSNALKFRGPAPLQIHLSAERQAAQWVFALRDNGIGIEPQYFERIFGIFQRLHTRNEYPGTGIGLAYCKKIVERHGGRIWVESAPGAGATFYFSLPGATRETTQQPTGA